MSWRVSLDNRVKVIGKFDPAIVDGKVEDFLRALQGPTAFFIKGRQQDRCRALVTLLHGNEPSGVKALQRWLKSGATPVVNVVCIVASVDAALRTPPFSHRVVPGKRDLNRCFRAPFDDSQGEIAEQILEILTDAQPEAVVDIHNTSGSGPGFGVAVSSDEQHQALVSLFSDVLVTNDLRIGALMEIADHLCPTATIECGGRMDRQADELAFRGIQAFMNEPQILSRDVQCVDVNIVQNPVRLELDADCGLTYASTREDNYDLVLLPDIERLNYGAVAEGTHLGWVGERGQNIFRALDHDSNSVVDELIRIEGDKLYTAQALKLFMVTNDAQIAKMDCLLYAAREDGQAFLE